MRLEQAIVYVLATSGRGMTTIDIARVINEDMLYLRNDGKPVSDKQVYAIVRRNENVFAREGGLVYLIM